jgi:hypothetical protein
LKHVVRFLIELTSLAVIGYGLWRVNPSAAMVVVGSLVLASSVIGKLRGN